MSTNLGTLVISPIRPYDSTDTFPSSYANEALGGYHSVANNTDRDAIPTERREFGMLVYVQTPGVFYLLVDSGDHDKANNSNWQPSAVSGASGYSGCSGYSGVLGYSGYSGVPGYSGYSGSAAIGAIGGSATTRSLPVMVASTTIGTSPVSVSPDGTIVQVANQSAGESQSNFSTNQMALSQLHGGAYFGRTGLKESQLSLSETGINWIQTNESSDISGVAMSSDGKYQSVGNFYSGIFISSDFGATWALKTTNIALATTLAMSSDGKIQIALGAAGDGYQGCISTDFGDTWTAIPFSTTILGGEKGIYTVKMSSDGHYITAVGRSGAWISNDLGQTWSNTLIPSDGSGLLSVAMSSDGRVQFTASPGALGPGTSYISQDYGDTWTVASLITSTNSNGIDMSSDGRVISVTAGSYVNVSNDYGLTWANYLVDSGITIVNIALSGNGEIQAVVGSGFHIYISMNYGSNWTISNSTIVNWSSIAMSSDGKVVTALTHEGYSHIYVSYATSLVKGALQASIIKIPAQFSGESSSNFSTNQMALSQLRGGAYFGKVGITENQLGLSDIGVNWVQRATSLGWASVALSSNGRIQTTVDTTPGYIWISSDYGQTWSQKASSLAWQRVAMSSDGKTQTAVVNSGYIYVSYDYGNTWIQKATSSNWTGIAMSSDGRVQTAVAGGDINISQDFGVTWILSTAPASFSAISMSSDGRIQTTISYADYIYVSYDYGVTWNQRGISSTWFSTAMSSDGKIQVAVNGTTYIYISTDYGVTWLSTGFSMSGADIAMSSSGEIIAIAPSEGSTVYISTDYGATWSPTGPSLGTGYIAMSSDGKVITSAKNGGYLYTSYAISFIDGALLLNGPFIKNGILINTSNGGSIDFDCNIYSAISWRPISDSSPLIVTIVGTPKEGMEITVLSYGICNGISMGGYDFGPSGCTYPYGMIRYDNTNWRLISTGN
jgi:hypothetical protein